MRRFLPIAALSGALVLSGCAVATTMRVTGANGYYHIGNRLVSRKAETDRRRFILARREPADIGDPAPVTVGVAYRFIPICANGPAWDRPVVRTARIGSTVELQC